MKPKLARLAKSMWFPKIGIYYKDPLRLKVLV